jgi:hypothetical protein
LTGIINLVPSHGLLGLALVLATCRDLLQTYIVDLRSAGGRLSLDNGDEFTRDYSPTISSVVPKLPRQIADRIDYPHDLDAVGVMLVEDEPPLMPNVKPSCGGM